MEKRLYKNLAERKNFYENELYNNCSKSIQYNRYLPTVVHQKLSKVTQKHNQTVASGIARIRNLCIETYRARSTYRALRLERNSIKRRAKLQLVPGLRRSS
jgi:ribosomal protein S14